MSKQSLVFPLDFWYLIGILIFITGLIVGLLKIAVSLPANILVFIFIVVFMTLITIRLRNALYCHLIESKTEEELLKKLKIPFRKASRSLDIVNTSALLEKFYGKEKFDFCELSLSCEKWNYFCQILPNLLIAFGLLGTFWGITQNLSGISEILNKNTSNGMISVENLQTPLKSMGIAFSSSLVALFCSVLITLTNFIWNTNIAKNNLLNSIEDELDNSYQPTIEGDTRLSKVVKEMSTLQDQFLTQFHEKVGSVLANTLRPVAQQIAQGNQEAMELAKKVYQNFTESSTTIKGGADKFEFSINEFRKEIEEIKNLVTSVSESSKILENGANIFQEASNKIQESKFSENLENLTHNLANTQAAFTQSTELLSHNLQAIIENNQKSTELAEQVYTELRQSSAQWQDGAIVFLESAEILKDSQFADNLVKSSSYITDAHQQFAATLLEMNSSLNILKDYSQAFKVLIKQLLSLGNEVKLLNQQSGQLLNANQDKIVNEITTFENLSNQITLFSSNFEKTLSQISGDITESVNQNTSSNLENVSQLQQQINQLTNSVDSQVTSLVQSFKDLLQAQTNSLTETAGNALQKTYQYNQSIFDILQEIQEINSSNNQELKKSNESNTLIVNKLQLDTQTVVKNIENTQQNIERLISASQLQSSDLLQALEQQNKVLKKSLQDHAEWQVKENSKERKANLTIYENLERSLLNLGEINSKLSPLTELLNQQANNSNTKSNNLTDIIDKLKGI